MYKTLIILFLFFIFSTQRAQSCGEDTNTLSFIGEDNQKINKSCQDKNVCRVPCGSFVPECRGIGIFEITFSNNVEELLAFQKVCLNRAYQIEREVKAKKESFFSRNLKWVIRKIDSKIEFAPTELRYQLFKAKARLNRKYSRVMLTLIRHARLLKTFGQLCIRKPGWELTLAEKIKKLESLEVKKENGPEQPSYYASQEVIGAFLNVKMDIYTQNFTQNPLVFQVENMRNSLARYHERYVKPFPKLDKVFKRRRREYSERFVKYMVSNHGSTKLKTEICKCSHFEHYIKYKKEKLSAPLRNNRVIRAFLSGFMGDVDLKRVPITVLKRAKDILQKNIDDFERSYKTQSALRVPLCSKTCKRRISTVNQKEVEKIEKNFNNISNGVDGQRERRSRCCKRNSNSKCCKSPLRQQNTGERYKELLNRLLVETQKLLKTVQYENDRNLHQRTRTLSLRIYDKIESL